MDVLEPKHGDAGDVRWGYGRYARGVSEGHPLDLVPVALNSSGGLSGIATVAMINKTGDDMTIPSTEGSARQHGRGIAQAVTVEQLLKGEGEGEKEAMIGDAS